MKVGLLILNLLRTAAAVRVILARNVTSVATRNNDSAVVRQAPSYTFPVYYESHTGRGAWKWNVALDMYQRHFSGFASKQPKILEIGVQSGGSIDMYKAVLPTCHYYGMDINRNCLDFQDATTAIYIGDQASIPVWNNFFGTQTATLDIAIDDGGHQPHQMLATIMQVLPHMNPGGFFLTEDIHGVNDDYLMKFFNPASLAIVGFVSTTGAHLESVHLYPFVLGVQMAGGNPAVLPAPTVTVGSIPELLEALPKNLGGTVSLSNPSWPTFFSTDGLVNIFSAFYGMYGGVVKEEPENCHDKLYKTGAHCTMIATNTPQQDLVKAVHILPSYVLVEVAASPPRIAATRKGETWIPYYESPPQLFASDASLLKGPR